MTELFNTKEKCCGCSACETICPVSAISFYCDEMGFRYPHIDKNLCIDCGLCVQVCDFKKAVDLDKNAIKIYAAKIKDDNARLRSSSGGMFIAFSDYFLKKNGVVYGAAHNKNLETVHIRGNNINDRDKCIGSKYVQSNMLNIFYQVKNDLISKKDVFFTGTPCQIAGLNSYLKYSSCPTNQLFTADLLCHGVPSPRLFMEFIAFCEKQTGKKIIEFRHRPKDHFGWSYNEEIIYSNGECDYTSNFVTIWRTLFLSYAILRPSCYKCKYATNHRYGDITIADFWGIEHSMPDFYDDKGVSLLFLNTNKSLRIFDVIKQNLIVRESTFSACSPFNTTLSEPSACSFDREKLWLLYYEKGFEAVARKYGRYGLKYQIKRHVRNILARMHLLDLVKKVYMKK